MHPNCRLWNLKSRFTEVFIVRVKSPCPLLAAGQGLVISPTPFYSWRKLKKRATPVNGSVTVA
jgi:hypothetical protein